MKKTSSLLAIISRTALISMMAIGVVGCGPDKKSGSVTDGKEKMPIREMLAQKKIFEKDPDVAMGVEKLLDGEYDEASHYFSVALDKKPSNSAVHYLNALTCHLQANEGDPSSFELAAAGYEQALKHNPNNALAALQLGRVKAAQKDYIAAQDQFAQALLIQPKNKEALYELANASYLAGDIKHSSAAIDQYLKRHKDEPEAYRAAALIYAAMGESQRSLEFVGQYKQLASDDSDVQVIEHRVDDLRHLHASGRIMLAQADQSGTQPPNLLEGLPIDQPQQDAAPAAPSAQMVVMDAIVLRISDVNSTQKGNNILDNFTAAISPGNYFKGWAKSKGGVGSISSAPVFAPDFNQTTPPSALTPPGATFDPTTALPDPAAARLFTQGISFGTIRYSMKIANSTKNRVEVVGRPTLVATMGKKAEFFSGTELLLGLTGQFGGSITKTPVGITLELTLNSIENGRANVDVTIYGSLIADSTSLAANATTGFSQIGISRIKTTINVGLGETIMLGGIQERNDIYNKDGLPGAQDVPLLQYLFSQETTYNERKSVMYLITPRSYGDTVRDIKSNTSDHDRRFNLSELEHRHKDWYDPRGNSAIILRALSPLYREFRTGDIKPIDWYYPEKLEDQISELGRFMYF